jgi:hypothetical protein
MKRDGIHLGYHITLENGATFRPLQFHFWKQAADFDKNRPSPPSPYLSDLLLGVSFLRLNSYCASPLAVPFVDSSFAQTVWNEFEPHRELFKKSQKRVEALYQHTKAIQTTTIQTFEKEFSAVLERVQQPWGFDLRDFSELVGCIEKFEKEIGSPLLYNFKVKFSPSFEEKLLSLDSFLFHLRAVIALDHNAHVQEPAYEAVKVDSVQDYIPRADYVVSDALLYWHFKKFSVPWIAGNKSDVRVQKLFVEPVAKAFKNHIHNACFLIDQLPEAFLNQFGPENLEEALYLVQMDWLMGSGPGLLLKIREEIYGLEHGYEKVFWHDWQDRDWSQPSTLKISCELSQTDFLKKAA